MMEVLQFGWVVVGIIGAVIGVSFLIGIFSLIVEFGDDIARWCERQGWN